MRRLMNVLVIGLAAVAFSASAASAQGPRHNHWGGGVEGFGWVLRTVNLSDAQKAQVGQILASHRSQFQALRQQLQTAQKQLGDKLYDGSTTPAQLVPLTQQIGQLRDQMSQLGIQVAFEIRSVLTPDQLAKAAQTRQRLSELRGEIRALMQRP